MLTKLQDLILFLGRLVQCQTVFSRKHCKDSTGHIVGLIAHSKRQGRAHAEQAAGAHALQEPRERMPSSRAEQDAREPTRSKGHQGTCPTHVQSFSRSLREKCGKQTARESRRTRGANCTLIPRFLLLFDLRAALCMDPSGRGAKTRGLCHWYGPALQGPEWLRFQNSVCFATFCGVVIARSKTRHVNLYCCGARGPLCGSARWMCKSMALLVRARKFLRGLAWSMRVCVFTFPGPASLSAGSGGRCAKTRVFCNSWRHWH